ncbi:FAD dependent oxidoreductase-domain-containing protein [Ilyonectria robusta]|uniref:FAD dependent oxidoreductase-domain-containing protein n=1 Tax=Ilyonectria robusta TaxID=1079257 RepID=UPI001E8DCA76|nr:FAD dependent oxidoreductase-domain-containing protein [Ilyonectria robusta]KAH8685041.1 FAD dependent oxidoreductase-domain-containing protein [Ilyonectria robusta]
MTLKAKYLHTGQLLGVGAGETTAILNPATSRLLSSIQSAILTDPGLPRPGPTVSAWQVPVHPTVASIQSPALPQCTDFAVIGSGITGCSVTKALLEHPGSKDSHITVLEARTLVSGATGRNGGHLVTPSGHTYGPLARQHGVEAAKQITRFSILNINHIMKMVREMDQELQTECQIRDVIKVMAVGDDETWGPAKASVLDFQKAVPEHSSYHRIIEKDKVPEMWNIKDASGAVEHEAGAIWPYRLLTGVYERLLKKYPARLAIEANTPATQVKYLPAENTDYPYAVTTPRGIIRAKRIIHCTNGHASHLLPGLAGGIYPFRGTMSVQDPGPSLKNLGASRSWSLSHKSSLDVQTGLYITGLFYLQQNPLTGQIWIGNETAYMKDILTSDDTYVPEEARQALSTVLPRFFLEGWGTKTKSEVKAIWSGIQGHTTDGLPLVGRVPKSITGSSGGEEQWIAAGFNGYGMDKCWLTGEALAKMMLGEDVSGWFPECYLLTEKRLSEELTVEKTLLKFANIAHPEGFKSAKL